MNFNDILKNRDLFFQSHSNTEIKCAYVGFDGTAISLQIGNLTGLAMLRLANLNNIKTIGLVGGATSLIGDPEGKKTTRKKLEKEEVEKNIEGIKNQIQKLCPEAKIVNNIDWISNLTFLDFLTQVAPYYPLSALIKLKTFADRLENNDPLSVQELLYPLIQGYDFAHLYKTYGCNAQFGGHDQWCNLIAGLDLIKRKYAEENINIVTAPLLTNSAGQKMGKSVNGAVYINPNLCSVFDFWQFWRNIEDSMVKTCLLRFTLIEVQEINELIEKDINEAKIKLANEVTTWVHSAVDAKNAQNQAKSIFIDKNTDNLETITFKDPKITEIVANLMKISNTEAKKLIKQNAVKIDDEIISSNFETQKTNFVISIGKKQIFKIKID